jgi:hypothetical protein
MGSTEGRGYDAHCISRSSLLRIAILAVKALRPEVDYQDTSADFWSIADNIDRTT